MFTSNPGTVENGQDANQKTCGTGGLALGNPILPSTGNKIEPETDFVSTGEMPLFLKRTYNRYWGEKGLFGYYWLSNFDLRIAKTPDNKVITAYRSDGRKVKYVYSTVPSAGAKPKSRIFGFVDADDVWNIAMTRNTVLVILIFATIFSAASFVTYWIVLPTFFAGSRSYLPLFLFTGTSFLSGFYLAARRMGIGVNSIAMGLVAAGATFAISISLIVRFLGS